MAIIDFFKDRWGRIIYPKTVAQAIYDLESGERLDKYFDKNFYEKIGDPEFLETVDKSTLVSAINELKGKHDSHLADYTAHNLNSKANKAMGQVLMATLKNGWSGELYYSKNDIGLVWLRGTIKTSNVDFNLPITHLANGYFNGFNGVFLPGWSADGRTYIGIVIRADGGVFINYPAASELKANTQIAINIVYYAP